MKFDSLTQEFQEFALDIIRYRDSKDTSNIKIAECIIYISGQNKCIYPVSNCPHCLEKISKLIISLQKHICIEIVDCINISRVQQSINIQNYECQMTQKFIAYRSIGEPVNYAFIKETEASLNNNIEFKREMEGSIRAYILIFVNTFQNSHSFEEYEIQLLEQNIVIPDYIKTIIKEYLIDTGKTLKHSIK